MLGKPPGVARITESAGARKSMSFISWRPDHARQVRHERPSTQINHQRTSWPAHFRREQQRQNDSIARDTKGDNRRRFARCGAIPETRAIDLADSIGAANRRKAAINSRTQNYPRDKAKRKERRGRRRFEIH